MALPLTKRKSWPAPDACGESTTISRLYRTHYGHRLCRIERVMVIGPMIGPIGGDRLQQPAVALVSRHVSFVEGLSVKGSHSAPSVRTMDFKSKSPPQRGGVSGDREPYGSLALAWQGIAPRGGEYTRPDLINHSTQNWSALPVGLRHYGASQLLCCWT